MADLLLRTLLSCGNWVSGTATHSEEPRAITPNLALNAPTRDRGGGRGEYRFDYDEDRVQGLRHLRGEERKGLIHEYWYQH